MGGASHAADESPKPARTADPRPLADSSSPPVAASASPTAWNWKTWGGATGAAAIVTLLLLVLAGVFHPKADAPGSLTEGRSTEGRTFYTVTRLRRPRFESAVGAVKPVHEVTVASKLLARVLEVRVKAGQAVARGELLVRLDDVELQARLAQLEAAVEAAEANREKAELDLRRIEKLRATAAASQADLERAAAAVRTTTAERNRLRQSVVEARAALGDATLVSPIDGLVVEKSVDAGDTATPGRPLLTIYDPRRMQLVASVRESLARRLAVGQTIGARLDALDLDCEATISEIVPESQAASRSFLVKVSGPCPPGVYSGMFGRIDIPLDDEFPLVVPAAAVRRVGQLELLDVVEQGRVVRRYIQTGRMFGDQVELLSGAREGERAAAPSGPTPASKHDADRRSADEPTRDAAREERR